MHVCHLFSFYNNYSMMVENRMDGVWMGKGVERYWNEHRKDVGVELVWRRLSGRSRGKEEDREIGYNRAR